MIDDGESHHNLVEPFQKHKQIKEDPVLPALPIPDLPNLPSPLALNLQVEAAPGTTWHSWIGHYHLHSTNAALNDASGKGQNYGNFAYPVVSLRCV